MTREDLLDLKAYLFSVPPVVRQNRPSELSPPFGWRPAVAVWKWMNFSPGAFQPDSTRSQQWNRGAYLATAVSHCGECHTPRGLSGGPKSDMYYAGTNSGPEGELAPNITPDEETGIGDWSVADISWYLQTGLKPDGDDTQGLMGEVIANGYGYLSEEDLEAIAVYLRSLEPIQNRVTPAPR
jgi:mono/diheme cytochrome c family protein